jgi:carbohydrate-selective porin OprB
LRLCSLPRRALTPILAICASALVAPQAAWADDAAQPPIPAASSSSSASPLSGPIAAPADPRDPSKQNAVQFTFSYFGDLFDNPSGGVRQGAGYDGRFGVIVDADLAKLVGWSGAKLHASFHQIHGSQFSAGHLDNLATVSGIEAPPLDPSVQSLGRTAA